jgi:hypothetical protein
VLADEGAKMKKSQRKELRETANSAKNYPFRTVPMADTDVIDLLDHIERLEGVLRNIADRDGDFPYANDIRKLAKEALKDEEINVNKA